MKEESMVIQPLEIENNCVGIFAKDTFYFEDFSEPLLSSKYCWSYSPIIKNDLDYEFVSVFLKKENLKNYSSDPAKYEATESLLKAQKKASSIAKIDCSELCFFDVIPDHLLNKWFILRDEAISNVLEKNKKPDDYDILHKIHVLTSEISKKPINFLNQDKRIIYDIYSSATGRLTTKKSSVPILNISKPERHALKPKNDLYLELDINGAEIRTLLAFSGIEQPREDIHSWNMKSLPSWVTRAEAKEKFFAWLYNPTAENKDYEKYYNKKAYLRYYDGGIVKTPFGRRLPVDERRALNYLLQSTTSDIVLASSYNIMKLLKNRKSHIAFTMHDSVILDFAKEDHHLVRKIKDIFESNIFGKFLSTVSIGKDFGNLRKIEI